MKKLRHTPGPWKKCNANNGNCPCGLIWDSTGEIVIATATSTCKEHESSNLAEGLKRGGEQFIANARLIAAAPELLETTINLYKAVYTHYEPMTVSELEIMQNIGKLIEKATGLPIDEVLS